MGHKTASLKFWGVRGSIASGPSSIGSHTSCVELNLGNGHSIFFDAGTGIRSATSAARKFNQISLCLSHFHWDHIQGLPFMTPLVNGFSPIQILSGFEDTEQRLQILFDGRFHPVQLSQYKDQLSFKTLNATESMSMGEVEISCAALNHPGISYAFRVSSNQTSFCYATDSDYDPLSQEARSLLQNADWAVLDSQFLVGDSLAKAEYGHASFRQAIDVAVELRIKNCILFHFDPAYTDEELYRLESQAEEYVNTQYPHHGLKVWMAKEGLSLPLIF